MSKTPITDPIAVEEIIWVHKDGSEIKIIARVGRPYHVQEGEWACPSEIVGLDPHARDIHGEGSMQALHLAINFIRIRLGGLLEDGENLYSNDRSKWTKEILESTFGR
jgi:hypothetical protein